MMIPKLLFLAIAFGVLAVLQTSPPAEAKASGGPMDTAVVEGAAGAGHVGLPADGSLVESSAVTEFSRLRSPSFDLEPVQDIRQPGSSVAFCRWIPICDPDEGPGFSESPTAFCRWIPICDPDRGVSLSDIHEVSFDAL